MVEKKCFFCRSPFKGRERKKYCTYGCSADAQFCSQAMLTRNPLRALYYWLRFLLGRGW